jgi:hypothetical protein
MLVHDFEVFQRTQDGSYVWIGSAETLAVAREVIKRHVHESEQFAVYCVHTDEKTWINAEQLRA